MSGMLFYKNIIPISLSQHKNTKIRQVSDFSFAAHTHLIPLSALEFFNASREFPIVFIKYDDGGFSPVIMLGVQEKQNLYVSDDGKWLSRFLPAYVSRYPFVPSAKDENADQLAVCIDEAYAGFNAEDGEPLFQEDGAPSPLLEQATKMLQEFHARTKLTIDFCNRLAAKGLFEEMKGEFGTEDGKKKIKLTGFHVISERKLLDLDDNTVLDLFRKSEIGCIYSHLISLGNFQVIVDRFFSMNKD